MKKVLVALGLFLTIGCLGALPLNHAFAQVKGEEVSSEVISEEVSSEEEVISEEISSEIVSDEVSEEIVSEETSEIVEEEQGFFDTLSQGAKDFLIVAKEILNQPIVIGGVSVSLGAIIIWVLGKLFSSLGKKKLNELASEIEQLGEKAKDNVSKKDYNALVDNVKELYEVCKVLVDSSRNVKVKEKAKDLLKELDPIIQDNKEFVVNETKVVVDDGKVQLDKTAQDIVGIINKD